MTAVYERLKNVYLSFSPPAPSPSGDKSDTPLRMGILGAANIAPNALILPAKSSATVTVTSVAARDKTRAEAYAKKHQIGQVLTSYDELVRSDAVDAVYNPLPNGLHLKWTVETLNAGKPVLCEKPLTSNAQQARDLFAVAKNKNLVVLEAFHYRFHPALHEFAYQLKRVVSPTNPLVLVRANLVAPGAVIPDSDIRFNYSLAGGSLMDMGVYPISAVLYTIRVAGEGARAGSSFDFEGWSKSIEVSQASVRPFIPTDKKLLDAKIHLDANGKEAVDEAATATLLVPVPGSPKETPKIPCEIECSLRTYSDVKVPIMGWKIPKMSFPTLEATLKDGTKVQLVNFVGPWIYHHVTVTTPDGVQSTTKAYTPTANSSTALGAIAAVDGRWDTSVGKPWWSTYRYMIEAFESGLRAHKRGTPPTLLAPPTGTVGVEERKGGWAPVWMDNRESVVIMECVDKIYDKNGMGKRI
ncbi:hypothetical protein HDU93_004148 [Gonapodya sp. JEL0774]|nr:hypothetical protein HDU93_004148 [Gonapodya sp. JEL0774]